MNDDLAAQAVEEGDDPEIKGILEEACRLTQMGFVALARVTEERWIACQALDRIEFGLDPGDELDIKTTICDDIRKSGHEIIIDEVAVDPEWRTHPVPALYGFQSYAALPVVLADGSFFRSSSRPMMNRRRIRPISDTVSMLAWSLIRPKPIRGPINTPASRYASNSG